jgi:subtilisin-like proprotein convertase family protein
VQPHSDDDFNYVNVRDITLNIQTGNSSSCAVTTPLTNNPPTANAGADYTIPKGTAYILEGTATDVDGLASLTYNWSQNDPAQSPGNGAPQSTYTVGPLYRSISPQTSPDRYMPALASVIAGNLTPTWEVTPSVGRTMNFSFIVRDNDILGGQTASDLMTVTVSGTAGPFTVTSQSTNVVWNAGATETVTWNVAGTNAGAVNCPNVNIYLSVDGGLTYPYTLASNVPNNGSASVSVPAVTSTTARVMVRGAGNIFYALNGANFSVQASEFVMNVATASQNVCPPSNIDYTFTYNTFLGFTDVTTFSAAGNPAGTTVTFTPATAVTDGTPVTMSISGLTASNVGSFTITITGTSATVTKTTNVTLNVQDPAPAVAVLISPANNATGVVANAILTWTAATSPGVLFDVDVATDVAFTSIVASATALTSPTFSTPALSSTTTYYWRVRAYNICGTALMSAAWSFTTNACLAQASANIPVSISPNGTPTITSTLTIPLTGTVNDVNVVGLVGVHTYMGDLNFSLTSPQGTNIPLFGNICGTDEDFDLNLDDAAIPGALPCPPIGGGTYQPQTALSTFNGQAANGVWTLTVYDAANLDGGSLDGWGLQICLNTSTGIVKYETSSSVSIFPNPTEGVFTINVKGVNEMFNVEITNSIGQILQRMSVDGNTNHQFDLSKYSAGVYVVNVTGKNMTEQRKLTITHN